jgi:hypothetical protein
MLLIFGTYHFTVLIPTKINSGGFTCMAFSLSLDSTHAYNVVQQLCHGVQCESSYLRKFCDFCVVALSLAMSRDGSSGGIVRLADISEEGIKRFTVSGDQLPHFNE